MPLPSPTTTRAVKLNLRPPLTTLATRLIVTTRSRYTACFSLPPRSRRSSRRSRRSPPPWPPRRGPPGISCSFLESCRSSQRQPGFPRAVREGGDAAVVLVAATVEDHRGDARGLRPLGDERADLLGLGRLVPRRRPHSRVHGGGGRQGAADGVVHDLHDDVPRGPVHHQPRPGGAADDLLAHPQVTPDARARLRRRARPHPAGGVLTRRPLGLRTSHDYLPAFPTLRRITSPWYRTPLALYGSGLRSLRIRAAVSPTSCLSMPSTTNLVGASTRKVMPSGGVTTTGWLKPSANSRSLPLAVTR